jgi:transcriptional coactivator HFI1/ADA1
VLIWSACVGRLSDAELFEEIGPFIKGPKIRLHNSLLTALISNITRDSPQAEVATWVSASDKPNSVSKMPAGDVNERRLKKEVMAISARERRRIKEVSEKVCAVGLSMHRCMLITADRTD